MQIGVPPSSGVAFISLPSISAATFPNYVSKSVFLAMQSHQRVRRGLVETPVSVRCGSPCRLRLTTSPGPRSADSASSSHLSSCFSDGLTPGASYCMHHLAPQMLFLKTPTFQRLSLSPAEAPRPLTPGLPRGGPGSRTRAADMQSTCSVQGQPGRSQSRCWPFSLLARTANPHARGVSHPNADRESPRGISPGAGNEITKPQLPGRSRNRVFI